MLRRPVEFTLHTSVGQLDLRSPDAAVITAAEEALFGRIAEIEELAGVQIRMTSEHKWDVNPYSEGGVKLSRSVAEELEFSHGEVMTVAGHDSTNMKDTTPTVMLFVPSVRGISHNVREYTTDEDIVAGVDMLAAVIRRLADGELSTEAAL